MIADQEREMASPSSLLTRRLESVRRMYRASLTRRLVVFLASSSTLVWLHSTWWSFFQACSAIADFSSSPRLVAALCSLRRVSKALLVSPMYVEPQLHGISYITYDLFSAGSVSLTLDSCRRSVGADRKTVLMLNPLHTLRIYPH